MNNDLERMGDLATNIAEDVIFLIEGEIVRHNLQTFLERSAFELPARRAAAGAL